MPVAGPSRSRQLVTRSAHFDRYTTIHAFFTRQALSPTPTSVSQRRWSSTNRPQEGCENCSERRIPPTPTRPPPHKSVRKDHAQDYTPFIRRLIASSNAIQSGSPHRPSKELVGGGRGYGFGSSGLRSEGGGGLIRTILVLLPVGSCWVTVSFIYFV
jgi:hypothetical protein